MNLYALLDPRSKKVRYIGKTHRRVEDRLREHLKDARSSRGSSYRANWIRSLLKEGLTPDVLYLDSVAGSGDEEEVAFIGIAKSLGCDLVNYAPGGRGVTRHTPEVRARISAAKRGAAIPPEVRAKISEAGKGRKFSAEHRARIAAANARRWSEGKMEAARKNMSASATAANKRRTRDEKGRFRS